MSEEKTVSISGSVPEFDINKLVVRIDIPTQHEIDKAEKEFYSIISYVELPFWLSIFDLDREFSELLLTKYLKALDVKRSGSHAVFFCDHKADKDKLFELYQNDIKEMVGKTSQRIPNV